MASPLWAWEKVGEMELYLIPLTGTGESRSRSASTALRVVVESQLPQKMLEQHEQNREGIRRYACVVGAWGEEAESERQRRVPRPQSKALNSRGPDMDMSATGVGGGRHRSTWRILRGTTGCLKLKKA